MDSKNFKIADFQRQCTVFKAPGCMLHYLVPPVGDDGHGVEGGGATLYTTLPGDVLL